MSNAADDDGPEQAGAPAETSEPTWLDRLRATFGLAEEPALRELISEGLGKAEDGDGLSAQERVMLRNILRFGSLRVDDVMVPRADIIALDESASLGEVLLRFEEVGHSRIPIFRGTLDDPRGVVHVKDVLPWLMKQAGEAATGSDERSRFDLGGIDLTRSVGSLDIARPVHFVPPSMPAAELLVHMQTTRNHLALVVDEYGGTDGLVSIEDLVEEVVGEIEDEHDVDDEPMFSDDAHPGLVADARAPVDELEQRIGRDLLTAVREDDVDTLGGLVFALIGRVPVRGERVAHPSGIEFEVLDADSRRIKKLRVHEPPAQPRRTPDLAPSSVTET